MFEYMKVHSSKRKIPTELQGTSRRVFENTRLKLENEWNRHVLGQDNIYPNRDSKLGSFTEYKFIRNPL
jgi:regulator of replication initiation timing